MKTHLSLCLLLLAVLCGCKKDKEEPAPDRRTLLTSRAWRLDQVLVGTNPITDPSQLALLGPLNGATVKFNADGTLTATQASGAVTSGTWEFTGATQDLLKVTLAGGQIYDFTLRQLEAAQLVLITRNNSTIPVPVELRFVPA